MWTTIWASVRLLIAALLGFGAAGTLGAVLQLLSRDSKGIVWVILVLGLAVSVLTTVLLIAHRGAHRQPPNLSTRPVGFVGGATLVVLPFALAPLLFPTAFAQAFGLPTVDLLEAVAKRNHFCRRAEIARCRWLALDRQEIAGER